MLWVFSEESDSALRTRPRIDPWLSTAGDALPRGRLRRGRAQHIVDTEEAVQDQAEPPVTEGEDRRRVELVGLVQEAADARQQHRREGDEHQIGRASCRERGKM